jgi:site-specific DNA recombinase
MDFAILARLSDESKFRKHERAKAAENARKRTGKQGPKHAAAGRARRPRTGLDINNRDEQVLRCTERLEAAGARVVHVYHEPHTSAWKRKRIRQDDGTFIYRVVRPVYKQALTDLSKGTVAETGARLDGLMILDVDRLTRDNRDLEDAIDIVVYRHRPILDWRGSLDLLTDAGRTVARGIVAYKNGQSADTAWRVANKHAALQREGIPAGGARAFGWQEGNRKRHPVEAPILKKAALDVLGGRSRNAVVAEWRRKGIVTSHGNEWQMGALTGVLRNPRMCGYRMITVHNEDEDNGQSLTRHVTVLLDAKGKPVKGQWEAIITPKQWRALLEIIGEAPARGDGSNARKYLSTGTLRCGREGCDSRIRAIKAPASAKKPEGFFWYQCPSKSQGGCGGVRIDGPATDAYIAKLVIAKYEQQTAKRAATAAPAQWTRQGELDALYENVAAAKAARKAERISAERYYADLAEYEQDEKALMRDQNAFTRREQAAAGKPVNLRADWDTLSLTEQRSYVESTLSAVLITSAEGRRRVPVADRLIPVPVPDSER